MFALALMLAVFALVVLGGSFLTARVLQYRNAPAPELSFQPTRYAGMHRLLDPAEVAFLKSQPGMSDSDIHAFTQKRRAIFRMYLRELSADFEDLHAQARELVTTSPDKNPELVEMLMKQQIRFWVAIVRIELHLALSAAGLNVDPREILETVEGLHNAIVRATTLPGPVPVA